MSEPTPTYHTPATRLRAVDLARTKTHATGNLGGAPICPGETRLPAESLHRVDLFNGGSTYYRLTLLLVDVNIDSE